MFSFRESHCRSGFFPLTLTRHTAAMRIGLFTNFERWELAAELFPELRQHTEIPANVIVGLEAFSQTAGSGALASDHACSRTLEFPWDLTRYNDWAIRQDIQLVSKLRELKPVPASNRIIGNPSDICMEDGATMEHCVINVNEGPVHIGRNALVMEGCMLRGPVSVGEGAVVKMGTSVYGATTIGPGCMIGGEVKNSIFFEYSNKAHHGYIGDAVIGAWCNLGAGTTCSNLRNNAAPVKVWHIRSKAFVEAGLKCGLIMGDHSRCAINTSFNTGTVTGVSVNLFQPGHLLPKYIPSFSWGVDTGIRYRFDKAIADINNWMGFKGKRLSDQDIDQLKDIYNNTDQL